MDVYLVRGYLVSRHSNTDLGSSCLSSLQSRLQVLELASMRDGCNWGSRKVGVCV